MRMRRLKKEAIKIKKKINKVKMENILYIVVFIFLLLWTTVSVIQTCKDPPSVEDLSVEERIKYEQMIFP